jgi:deoxyribose-phosphate aldolase
VTLKPSGSIAASVAAAGGAPAVKTSTMWSKGAGPRALALMIVFSTMGAPPKCVTFSSRWPDRCAPR